MGHFYLGVILIYLGSLGRMIGIKCPASQNVQAEERHSFSTTLEGRRKAQVRQSGRRTWSLQTSDATTPSEHSLLSQFANGSWGPGPFVFVSADAAHTNLLSPEAASLDPEYSVQTQGGPVQLPDGSWAPRSFLGSGTENLTFTSQRSPLPPSGQISAGVWVQGAGAVVRLNWYDKDLAFLGGTSSTVASTGGWTWSTITATPIANAAGVIVSADKASRATMPVLVWGSTKPTVWSDGQGCPKAVVSSMSRDQVLAAPGNTYSNVSFTVTEVG